MIQRLQSLFLLVVVILSSILLYISFGSKVDPIINNYKLFIISPSLSTITLLLFKNRRIQIILCNILVLIQFLFLAYYVYNVLIDTLFEETYFTIVFSSLNMILILLAKNRILKDEALIRSIDRIR